MINSENKLLVEAKDFKPSFKDWKIDGAYNPAAIRLPNKKIMLYVRVSERAVKDKGSLLKCPIIISEEEYKTNYQRIKRKDIIRLGNKGEIYLKNGTCKLPNMSHFKSVLLDETGLHIEKIDNTPKFTGMPHDGDYGVEDPRIVRIGERYLMTYVGVSQDEGVSSYLATSEDMIKWKRMGIIFREQNKDVSLFPQKIKDHYVAFNRPESAFYFSKPSIWISYSPDLIYWGRDKNLMRPRPRSWESEKIGAGPPPIKTKQGWLLIYHGVRNVGKGNVYSVGVVLVDLNNPEKVLARTSSKNPLFIPKEIYEKEGTVNNVVFPSGAIPDLNGKDLLLYCGGGDRVVSVKKVRIHDILESMEYYY